MPDIIVIGGSAGGLTALKEIVRGLVPDLPASVFIVLHVSPDSPFLIPEILARHSRLPVCPAVDGQQIQPGRIIVARPDYHLLLQSEQIRLARGPHENRTRPAIDPLFRSAAAAFNGRTVGVVLSGLLNDGSSGLLAIKRCGGIAIVQDPDDAEYPEMPASALRAVDPDHCLPRAKIADLINRLAEEPSPPPVAIPEEIRVEARMAEGLPQENHQQTQIGTPSVFGCPECGGTLWQLTEDQKLLRFRCRVGHAYTGETLLSEQETRKEAALWAAIRALEEQSQLLKKLAEETQSSGRLRAAAPYEERARVALEHARVLRDVLLQG